MLDTIINFKLAQRVILYNNTTEAFSQKKIDITLETGPCTFALSLIIMSAINSSKFFCGVLRTPYNSGIIYVYPLE